MYCPSFGIPTAMKSNIKNSFIIPMKASERQAAPAIAAVAHKIVDVDVDVAAAHKIIAAVQVLKAIPAPAARKARKETPVREALRAAPAPQDPEALPDLPA